MELFDLKTDQAIHVEVSNLTEHIKSKWEDIHSHTSVFRYKIDNITERVVDKKYLLQLNPNRRTKRRTPEQVINIYQQFDENKFNFTKVSDEEILFKLKVQNDDDGHVFIVNVSPISRYHTLLCPSIDKCLPQVITKRSVKLVIDLMLKAKDRDLRIGFNSLCALASVNHLHYHLFFMKNVLPVEIVKCKRIKGPVHCFENYPIPAFCFEVTENSKKIDEIYQILQLFLENSIAHNIFLTRGDSIENINEDASEMSFRFVIWPRKDNFVSKELSAFNIAVCELSGWFPIYSTEDFNGLDTEQLEKELRKWKIDNFEQLCDEVKSLF